MTPMARSRYTLGISVLSISTIIFSSLLVASPANAEPKNTTPLPLALQINKSDAKAQQTDQIIVKFSEEVKNDPAARGKAYGKIAKERGITIKDLRETAAGARVINVGKSLSASEQKLVIDSFKSHADVEYAEVDVVLQPSITPNDPSYSSQWNLFEEAAGLRLPSVWDKTTGAGQVVAVIDTGILPHSDLDANVLPGYDMISDAAKARDGGGRDTNPRDEGDWRAVGDCGATTATTSSWHGTHVAGTISAVGNNAKGVSGVAPGAKILPVRALGLCGGYMSDVSDSIIWSAGGTVSGAPVNANPARTINLSLSVKASCSTTLQIAVDTAVSRNSTVFVAAGNDRYNASSNSPANCNNVVTVGASGRNGNLAYYSNYGAVDVMAPGGDTAGYIIAPLNAGTTTPGTESYAGYQGTSMATPHAAAVGALMLAANPALTPAQIEAKLKATARPMLVACDLGCGSGLINPLSAVTVVAAPTNTVTSSTPTITGTPKMGNVLTASAGTWGPTGIALTYQWNRSGVAISGATSNTYSLTADDTNKVMTVTVTGSASGYTTVSKTSVGTAAVALGTFTAYRPVVTGALNVGSTLTAANNAWGPAPVILSYQWYRSGVAVSGATGTTYALTSADQGHTIHVRATGSKPGYSAGYLDSVESAAIAAMSTTLTSAVPTVSGTVMVGSTVTANAGTWGPAPVTLTYQWYSSGVAITGATGSTYVLTTSEQGKTMVVRVTGSKTGYTTVSKDSASTTAVAALTLTSSIPTISGSSRVGSKLTANAGTWGPAPVTLSYQWYRSGVAIVGASGSTYVLTTADKGTTLKVRVTGSKTGYATVGKDSAATSRVK
jgi:serine protease